MIARLTSGGAAWVAVALTLSLCAALGPLLPAGQLDWQPGLALAQPWRAFTAVAVHYSGEHLFANLLAVALTALFGLVARVPARAAVAWLAAWPLTHIGLLIKPELLHYGGLSGVVHAGVAVVIAWLLLTGTRAQRQVTLAVLTGFCAKLFSEAPWGPALRHADGWTMAVAPIAHATGALAGALCATLAAFARTPSRST